MSTSDSTPLNSSAGPTDEDDVVETGNKVQQTEGGPSNPLRIPDTSDESDTELRSETVQLSLDSEEEARARINENEGEMIRGSQAPSHHLDSQLSDNSTADHGEPSPPIHSAGDRKRRLTSAGEEARLQRTRSGGSTRQGYQQVPLPHRSVSMTVPSSRGTPPPGGVGRSYMTAIDITSSPPEAGPSVTQRRISRHSSNSISLSHQHTQTLPRFYSDSYNPSSPQGLANHTSSSNTLPTRMRDRYIDLENDSRYHTPESQQAASRSMSRIARRQHSAILRENANQTLQTGRPRVQSDAVRSRSARYSGIGFPPWQPGIMNERDLRRVLAGEEEEVETPLPQWQPDSEVSHCPICGNEFSLFYRKHHCRKCGRVVCASCSPHRITIPRQYIVRPPEASRPADVSPRPPRQVVDLTGEDPVMLPPVLNPALGGGEEVRLCNPCVPDPNPNPLGYGPPRTRGHRSSHSLPSMGNLLIRPADDGPEGEREHRGYSPEFFQYPGADEQRRQASATAHNQYHGSYSPRQSLPESRQPRRRTVSEQDLCPICGRIFPELSPENTTEAREAHIRSCIETYSAPSRYNASPRSPTSAPQPSEPSTSTAPTTTPTSTTTTTRRGPAPPPPLPPPPPAARMVEFTATEKDCIGEDGGVGECTICMEDYEVGENLARLECLCKFHKDCILDWFKQKMECPVHKYC